MTVSVRYMITDIEAAIAFYPGSCNKERLGGSFSTTIPLLVLIGEKDVWTPALPCSEVMDQVQNVQMHIYPDSYHDFDWPGMAVHEVPAFRTSTGVVPIEGMNEEARADALVRFKAFFASELERN